MSVDIAKFILMQMRLGGNIMDNEELIRLISDLSYSSACSEGDTCECYTEDINTVVNILLDMIDEEEE